MSSTFRHISRPVCIQWEHRLSITRDVFARDNPTLINAIREHPSGANIPRMAVFIDDGVLKALQDLPEKIEAWARQHHEFVHLVGSPVSIPGGEAGKSDLRAFETVIEEILRGKLCRHSFIIAIGGGAMLDVVGFAASTAHRGISLIRIPTTSLSQGDSGVGVKNAVNRFGRKNWLGTFAVPFAVINDTDFLDTLPLTEKRAGLVEALKVALIRDVEFVEWIEQRADALARCDSEALNEAIERSALIHFDHITSNGDPFEFGSSRPLDFGHWSAHKLEQISDFRLGHGEAVAIGMALDLTYAAEKGLLPTSEAKRFVRLIEQLGFETFTPLLDDQRLLAGLEEFREHLGGELTIPIVVAPGKKIDVHEMDADVIQQSIDRLRERNQVQA